MEFQIGDRVCRPCGHEGELEDYVSCGPSSGNRFGKKNLCKQCHAKRRRPGNRRQRVTRSSVVLMAKDAPCVDCGVWYPPHVMDLDHVRGVKVDAVSRMVRQRATEAELAAEVAKCDVVCANCHRDRTHRRAVSHV